MKIPTETLHTTVLASGRLALKPVPGQIVCEFDPTPEEFDYVRLFRASPEMAKACEMVSAASRTGDYGAAFQQVERALARLREPL